MESKTCPDCGKTDIKNMGSHLQFCKERIAKIEPKKQTEKPVDVPEPVHVPVSITNVTEFSGYNRLEEQEMAWFDTETGERISKPINYMGSFSDGKINIQTVLVLANDGTLVPPFMITGFLGIFPESFVFPDVQEEIHETEPPKSEEKQSVPIASTSEIIEKFKQKDNAVKPLTWREKIMGRKQEKSEPNGIDSETLALLKQIPAQGGK